MTIPTTPLKLPIQGKPLDEEGNWTPTWARTLQLLFNRVGAYTAPSNLQLAGAIGSFITGPSAAADNSIVVFDGITGQLVKDGGAKISALAPLLSPALSGVPTAPTAAPGTSTAQLATTSFISSAISGLGNVIGPTGSINNDIALFNGITGRLIADSGVQLSALAVLVSPAFSGVPTAPTAAFGTNSTQLATTAFVKATLGTPSYFSAHNNAVAQAIPNNVFTKLTFSTATYNVGGNFASSAWTPSGKLVSITAGVFIPTVSGTSTTISIYKNGVEYKRGSQVISATSGLTLVQVTCQDIAGGTDVYEVYVFQNTGASQNTASASNQTYFQGTTITP